MSVSEIVSADSVVLSLSSIASTYGRCIPSHAAQRNLGYLPNSSGKNQSMSYNECMANSIKEITLRLPKWNADASIECIAPACVRPAQYGKRDGVYRCERHYNQDQRSAHETITVIEEGHVS